MLRGYCLQLCKCTFAASICFGVKGYFIMLSVPRLKRNAYRILVGKPEGKRLLERPRRRWEDNIRMDVREIGWSGMDWIDLAQDRDQWKALVIMVMNLWVT
jgi:hypothetical protein